MKSNLCLDIVCRSVDITKVSPLSFLWSSCQQYKTVKLKEMHKPIRQAAITTIHSRWLAHKLPSVSPLSAADEMIREMKLNTLLLLLIGGLQWLNSYFSCRYWAIEKWSIQIYSARWAHFSRSLFCTDARKIFFKTYVNKSYFIANKWAIKTDNFWTPIFFIFKQQKYDAKIVIAM